MISALFLLVGKTYDSAFKSLAEDDPRGLLFLFAGVSLTEDVTIEPLPREVTAPALQGGPRVSRQDRGA